MQLHGAALERRDRDLGERDEVALGGVQEVRHAAAVAVARERQQALDAVALGLDADALLAVVDARGSPPAAEGSSTLIRSIMGAQRVTA